MTAELGTGAAYVQQVAEAERWAVEQAHESEDARVKEAMVEHADNAGVVRYSAMPQIVREVGLTRNRVGESFARLFRSGFWRGCSEGYVLVATDPNNHEFNPTEGEAK